MANYLTNHLKKKRILRRKEDELRRLIDRDASQQKLLAAAANVRDARIRVLRVKQNSDPETSVNRTKYLKIEDEINAVRALSAEAVLREYLGEKNTPGST